MAVPQCLALMILREKRVSGVMHSFSKQDLCCSNANASECMPACTQAYVKNIFLHNCNIYKSNRCIIEVEPANSGVCTSAKAEHSFTSSLIACLTHDPQSFVDNAAAVFARSEKCSLKLKESGVGIFYSHDKT